MWDGLTPLPWTCTPCQALLRWPEDRSALLLHSGRADHRYARRSVLASPAGTLRFEGGPDGQGGTTWRGDTPCPAPLSGHPLADWRAVMRAGPGLWIGYVSYDVRAWVEPVLRRAGPLWRWPVYEWAWCPSYAVHDTHSGRWQACGDVPELAAPREATSVSVTPTPRWSRSTYQAKVQRVCDYIAAGDVFQVNLAQQLTAPLHAASRRELRATYERLATASPAWYGAYLELADDGPTAPRTLLCTSPELFLEVSADGHVLTRPIKGTLPADRDPAELRDSDKDAAELAMIVDLLRNDLGRVCAYGSVRVEEARAIETHPTIHHGVATVSGQLHRSRDVWDLLRATLPGGSITGAPKVRAMQIIDELEAGPRGPYCGAIGWIHTTRDRAASAALNVAIRTIAADPAAGRLDLWAGGGIVADSVPGLEYDETLSKAAAMLQALRPLRSA